MTTASTNYSGRKVDILTHQGVDTTREQQVVLALGTEGYVCTGVQTVAQLFAKMFLTDVGSRVRDPGFGTHFLSQLRSGAITDENGVHAAFQNAVADIIEYLNNQEVSENPDEQLVDATLVHWDLRPTMLSMRVELTTAAGTTRVIYLPVKVAIR